MLRRIQAVLWSAVLVAPVTAVGQTAPAPKSPPTSNPPAQSAPAPAIPTSDAPPANPFAFPEEDSKKKEIPTLHDAAPDAPLPSAPSGADAHPYPGDAPTSPANDGFSSSSDNAPGNPPAGSAPEPPRHKLELHDAGSSGHVDTARADKDLSVADFYIKDGNYAGAYLRYKDAVVFDPDDADAHFGLADMARKTGKPAEAIDEYNAGLKLDPKNKHAKDAKKAVAELQAVAAKK